MILVKYGIFFSSLFLLHHGPYGGMGNGNLALVGEWNRRVYFLFDLLSLLFSYGNC